jgi:MFS family permease
MPSSALQVGLALVARDFGMTQGETAWILTAGTISSGSFLLLGGRLSDLYGRKKLLVGSYAYCCIWSIIAGFAHNK